MLIKSFSAFPFRFFLFVFLLLSAGCAGRVMEMPQPTPDLVKNYKSYTVHGRFPGMSDTGVRVNIGDYVSILAKGTINLATRSPGYIRGPEDR